MIFPVKRGVKRSSELQQLGCGRRSCTSISGVLFARSRHCQESWIPGRELELEPYLLLLLEEGGSVRGLRRIEDGGYIGQAGVM